VFLCESSLGAGQGAIWEMQNRTAQNLFMTCLSKACPFTVGVYGTRVTWASSARNWICQREELAETAKVLSSALPRGGKDLRSCVDVRRDYFETVFNVIIFRVQECMRVYPEATDVCVFSDYETHPFSPLLMKTTHSVSDWMAYRRRFSTTVFHFIGLCNERESASLITMARHGGGEFALVSR
jgi:hypothetical protein